MNCESVTMLQYKAVVLSVYDWKTAGFDYWVTIPQCINV